MLAQWATDDDRTTWVTASSEIEEVLAVGRGSEYHCDEALSKIVRSE